MVWKTERVTAELDFWLEIMQEHAKLIVGGLPCDEERLRARAFKLIDEFGDLRETAATLNETGIELDSFLCEVEDQVENIIEFKKDVLKKLVECKMNGLFPLMVDHTIREAELFLAHLSNDHFHKPCYIRNLENEVFWLRIMSEHAAFLSSLIDPSHHLLSKRAYLYEEEFLHLCKEARDLLDMSIHAAPENFAAGERFTDEVIVHTNNLRKFKLKAYELLSECKVFALVPPLIAEHVAREAEYFIREIS